MTTENKTTKRVYNLVIIDESGSMDIIRRQALAGINETITTCQKMQKAHTDLEQRITLITFDSDHFKLHYDNINAAEARPLTMMDYKPCAATHFTMLSARVLPRLMHRQKLMTMSLLPSSPTVRRTVLRSTTSRWSRTSLRS